MSRRGSRYTDLRVGAMTLLLIAAAVYLGFTKGHLPFLEHHYEVDATFAGAASQLNAGSPVRIAGVNVGKVVRMRRGPGGTAIATLRLEDRGRPLRTDATMKIRPRLFLEGNFFVDVRPGTPQAPELADRGSIPLAQTAIPVQFDQLLDVLQADTRKDLQQTIKGLATALDEGGAKAVNEGFRASEGAFEGTAVVAEAARGEQPGDLSRFVDATGRVTEAIAARQTDLRALLGAFARTTSTLADRRDDLAGTLVALDSTLGTARPALVAIDATLPALRTFATALRPGLRAAPAAITDLRPFVRQAGALVAPSSLPALTTRLAPALGDLAALQPGLTTLLTKATPVARCVDRNIVPVLNAELDDGDLSTGQPAYRELLHLFVGLASATSTFDGNGHTIRYGIGIGENSVASALPSPLGDLVSLGSSGVVGARPRYTPNTEPPFAPTADCTAQALPDLAADNTPATATRTRRITAADSRDAISAAVGQVRKGGSLTRARRALEAAAGKDGGR
jgi:phospholipid/cholesterol/gamma-HCH transport system substrate-binding protein